MSTITIDTLQLVEQLRSAGIPQEQAEAVVRVIAKSQDSLVTSDHFDAKLESALAPLRTDLAAAQSAWHIECTGGQAVAQRARPEQTPQRHQDC